MKQKFATLSKASSLKTFALIPYPAPSIPHIEITGIAARAENILSIQYIVRGDLENILLRAPSTNTRKDDLWKATCFEFFFATPQSPEYWECNMSPSSEWNIYHMDAYRRVGFREESAIQQLPFEFKQEAGNLSLAMSVDLSPILSPEQNIQLSITAIIQTKEGTETYWALAHPGPQEDFHLRESFVLEL